MPLRAERAKEELERLKTPEAEARRLKRVRDLPKPLRAIGEPLVERPVVDGRPMDYYKWQEARSKAAQALEGRPAGERRKVFDALFPAMGAHVAAAWDLFARLPYQSGYERRPFRATKEPVTGTSAREAWLNQLLNTTKDYERDVVWLATWAPYLGWGADGVGILCAAAMDAGGAEGEAVFDVIAASARGEHEIGAMGRHVTRALLVSEREDGWRLAEGLLRAAQAQEGLRQTILESVDEAHPTAFRRVLRLVVEEGLSRFSATVRAVDVWLGHGWDVQHRREVERTLTSILTYLESAEARHAALERGEGTEVYLALWSQAFDDAPGAVEPAKRLLEDESVERRYAAVYLLTQLGLVRSTLALLPALDDADLRVEARAFSVVERGAGEIVHAALKEEGAEGVFERLERLLARAPKGETGYKPLVWTWSAETLGRARVAGALVRNLDGRPTSRLLPYLAEMGPHDRASVAGKLEPDAAEARATLFALVGDASASVRERALAAIEKLTVGAEEARQLEGRLTRRAGDLRRGVLTLLARQGDGAAVESARRLLGGTAEQRTAGLELLRELCGAGRAVEACLAAAREFAEAHAEVSEMERSLLEGLGRREAEVPTLEDALGLMDPAERTRAVAPVATAGLRLTSEAAYACLEALDGLVHAHCETPVRQRHQWSGHEQEQLLGTMRWLTVPEGREAYRYAAYAAWRRPATGEGEQGPELPLRETWEEWERQRGPETRDADGLELVRAAAVMGINRRSWRGEYGTPPAKPDARIQALRHHRLVDSLVRWLIYLRPRVGVVDFLLAAVETELTRVPGRRSEQTPADVAADGTRPNEYVADAHVSVWLALARWHRGLFGAQWEEKHHVRLWRTLRWMDEPAEGVSRWRASLPEVARAHRAGGASEADLFDQLLGPRPVKQYQRAFDDLHRVSGRKGSPLFEECPAVREVVERCRRRIVEVEAARGDLPTAASVAALQLRYAGGLDALTRLLRGLGTRPFVRGWYWGGGQDRGSVLSHLIHATFPGEEDTAEAFAERMRAARLPRRRLLEVAVFAPQWARHVEHALGWPGLEEAVWWVHAHTKDNNWRVDQDIREVWVAQVAERTPLSAEDLVQGAVDVAWFQRVYAALGPERWKELDGAAKYASGGGGHKRAQLFADAMRGQVTRETLVARVKEKRHADSLRALGLAPLGEGRGRAEREREVLARYEVIQEFLRGSRQFGALRQESERLAASIAMQNLARTAGYRDPNRLRWAMEAEAVADLARGPVAAEAGAVRVTLTIDEWGKPQLEVTKQGKPLRAVPPAAKKDAAVAALVERKRDVERQASRMRGSLEEAMCRGDVFTGRELRELMAHPVLRPMLRSLVFIADGSGGDGGGGAAAGYPVDGGAALERHDGRREAVAAGTALRIAHPHDLLGTGEWHEWQRDCFLRERIQPFKQVFRELYVLTAAETEEGTRSRRYAGHQVNPRQGMALLQSRGWVNQPEEGPRRTFHDEGLTAWVGVLGGWSTPAEVEGLTLETVEFGRRGEWGALPLAEVPPRVFSEVMRDLDLVVSVAHQGGVDPEASASTVELRAALLRETCALLNVGNVRLRGAHALVDGKLGEYSVHLGSAVVHRQPGGSLCIVPVHSQHRGRLFLPFADDDPKTAEVVAKVLLLAKDDQIKDPTILEQLLAVR